MQKEVFVVATFILVIGLVISVYNVSLLNNQNNILNERVDELSQEVTNLQTQITILENNILVLEAEKSLYDAAVRNYTLQIQDLLRKNEVLQIQLKSWDIPVIWVSTDVQWTSSVAHPSENVRISFTLTNTTNENAQNIRISLPDSYMVGFQFVNVSDPRVRIVGNQLIIDPLLPRETLAFEVTLKTQSPGLYTGPLRIRWTGLGDFFTITQLNTRVS